jgi:mono/diheme cytochrome c family protein
LDGLNVVHPVSVPPWEFPFVTPRSRLVLVLAALVVSGCGEVLSTNLPVVPYSRSDDLERLLEEKPNLKAKVIEEVDKRFGPDPNTIHVPPDSGFRDGGLHLAGFARFEDSPDAPRKRLVYRDEAGREVEQVGGHAIYQRNCLHCHGATGDGMGVTAPFLFPRPRDFRRGIFKFTSTGSGAKPTRDDLRKVILKGMNGTSMPAYQALQSPAEVEQVIDYVMFLGLRGEFEYRLIQESKDLNDEDPEALPDDIIEEDLQFLVNSWREADERVALPDSPRTPSSSESIARGKELFLGKTKEQLQCSACHGPQGAGDGTTWIDVATFNHYVFGLDTSRARFKKLEEVAKSKNKKWGDDWGDPVRPANLTKGNYKGGDRPIDLYWRIRNGIGQEVMPAHSNLTSAQVWDLVNFVLALPYDPDLLAETPANPAPPNVASR